MGAIKHKEIKLSKRERKTLGALLADASTDWIELDWENYNQEIMKAFLLGRRYQRRIDTTPKKNSNGKKKKNS